MPKAVSADREAPTMARGSRARRRATGLLATGAAVCLLVLPGCRVLPGSGAPDESTSATPSAASTTENPSSTPTSATASPSEAASPSAAPKPAGSRCGERSGWAVIVAQGSVDCTTANAVIAEFESTEDIAPGGRPASAAQVEGWACEPIIFAKMGFEPDTYSSWCSKGSDAIMTIDATAKLPVAGAMRKPTDLRLESVKEKTGEWGFVTPSRSWYCGMFDSPRDTAYPSGVECFSLGRPIPGQSADGPEGPNSVATSVAMSRTGRVESFSSGDLALNYLQQSPKILQYGEVAYARGVACAVDQTKGVTCTVPKKSFTVSLSKGLSVR